MGAEDKAKPFPGPKRYQQRAAVVLPILVEYALRGDSVSYKSLAKRAAIPNPRNLDYVLGSIGTTKPSQGSYVPRHRVDRNSIGKTVRRLREAQGLTTSKLAVYAQVEGWDPRRQLDLATTTIKTRRSPASF